MATEIHQFTATIPKNTPKSALHEVKFTLDYRVVEMLDLYVPFGPQLLMGFYIAHSGQQIIPDEAGEFFVWNDIDKEWKLDELPTSQGWSLFGYNLDVKNDHAVEVRFHTSYPPDIPAAAPSMTFVSQPIVTAGVVF